MEKFNLLDEPWIVVMVDDYGDTKEVSLKELFANAHKYKRLAGENEPQNFSILRLLLAILHTVFSRFDGDGIQYDFVELDDRLRQIDELDEDDEDIEIEFLSTWKKLWNSEKFPDVIDEYLEEWRDSFNFYDEEKPFYQTTKDQMKKYGIDPVNGVTKLNPRLINRLISESNNKKELFSPASDDFKHVLTSSELVRWVVNFQNYTSTGEKRKFPGFEDSASKGWPLGIGGVYLSGDTLKDTLLLNLYLDLKNGKIQTPVWEKEPQQLINDIFKGLPSNLADLYTTWSRLLLVDTELMKSGKNDFISTVQLPGLKQGDIFLEPMTLWQYPKTGPNKNTYIPKQHDVEQSFWRSFGRAFITDNEVNQRRAGIIDWEIALVENELIDQRHIKVVAVGHGYLSGPSNMITSEIFDLINIHDQVLSDELDDGWVVRISNEVNLIKNIITKDLSKLAKDIMDIRNTKNDSIRRTLVEESYYLIDLPFRSWISSIHPSDNKNSKINKWREQLKSIALAQADNLVKNPSNRDYIGIEKGGKVINIVTAYNWFVFNLNKRIEKGE